MTKENKLTSNPEGAIQTRAFAALSMALFISAITLTILNATKEISLSLTALAVLALAISSAYYIAGSLSNYFRMIIKK